MKAAAIYARVSTADQADNGTSLESQTLACEKYAEQNGYTVVAAFKEQKSGATLDRPQLDQIRELARAGAIEAVIFYALDRLSRDETDTLILAHEWRNKGVELRCATVPLEDTPQGQFLLTMLAAVGKLERAGILERTMRGKRQTVRNGRIMNNGTRAVIFGYAYRDGTYEINEGEAYWVRKIYHWYCFESLSMLAIAYRLIDEGAPNKQGGKWAATTVRGILSNEAYTGDYYWGKRSHSGKSKSEPRPRSEWIGPVHIPPIVSRDVYERAHERVEYNKVNCKRRFGGNNTYLLRSMVTCELCGNRLSGNKMVQASGTYTYYYCSNKKRSHQGAADRCKAAIVNGRRAEEKVWNWLIERLSNPDLLMELLQSDDADRAQRERDEADLRQLLGLRLDLDSEKKKWSNAYLNDAISVDELKEHNQSIEDRRAGIDRNIEEIEARQMARAKAIEDAKTATELVKKIQRNLPKSRQILSYEEKRALLDAFHVKVTAKPDGDIRVTAVISEDLLRFATSGDNMTNGTDATQGDQQGDNGQKTETYAHSQSTSHRQPLRPQERSG